MRDAAYVLAHLAFVPAILFLLALLECDDPSSVDDAVIPWASPCSSFWAW